MGKWLGEQKGHCDWRQLNVGDAELRLPRYHAQIDEGGAAAFSAFLQRRRGDRCDADGWRWRMALATATLAFQ